MFFSSRISKQMTQLIMMLALFVPPLLSIAASASSVEDPPALTEEQKKKIADIEKAIGAADQSVQTAEDTRRKTSLKSGRVKSLSAFGNSDELVLRSLEDLTKEIKEINNEKLFKAVDDGLKAVEEAKSSLTTAKALPPAGSDAPETVKQAGTKADDSLQKLVESNESLLKAKEQLNESLKNLPATIKEVVDALPARLDRLKGLTELADAKKLLNVLPKNLSQLQSADLMRQEIRQKWTTLSPELAKAAPDTSAQHAGIVTSLDSLDTNVTDLVKKLPAWTITLTTHAQATALELGEYSSPVVADPQNPSVDVIARGDDGLQKAQQGSSLVADLISINAALSKLAVQLAGANIENFNVQDLVGSAEGLRTATGRAKIAASVLDEKLAGTFAEFVEDQISLYYFTDVPRLMRILNSATYEVGGIQNAREQAAEQRRKLTEAELALSDAQAETNSQQRRKAELEEELRQSRASLDLSDALLHKTSNRLKLARDEKTASENRLSKVKQRYDESPDDPGKKADYLRVKSRDDKAAADVAEAEKRNQETESERDAANQRNDAVKDEKDGLPPKIQDSKDKLALAQAEVIRQRKAAFLLAQTEVQAFASARDNAPFWLAPALASSTDPAKRVLMYAFNDSKTLFLRGNKADVSRVKEIVAGFDRPTPQARLTLWTLELNSTAGDQGVENFNKALNVIEGELSRTRAKVAASLSFLRDCIYKKVNEVAMRELERTSPAIFRQVKAGAAGGTDLGELRRSSFRFYQPEALYHLGYDPNAVAATSAIRASTGANDSEEIDPSYLVPDPAAITTLGEALMVLSLARPAYGKEIMDDFSNRLPAVLQSMGLGLNEIAIPSGVKDQNQNAPSPEDFLRDSSTRFALTKRALGLDGNGALNEAHKLTAAQLEIAGAIDRYNRHRIIEHVKLLAEELNNLDNRLLNAKEKEVTLKREVGDLDRGLKDLYQKLDEPNRDKKRIARPANQVQPAAAEQDKQKVRQDIVANQRDQDRKTRAMKEAALEATLIPTKQDQIKRELLPLLSHLYRREGRGDQYMVSTSQASEILADANELGKHNPLREANARAAAADQMLKEIIIAVEDDLDRHFVQPMIQTLRSEITKKKTGVGVGVIQRTSVLATNRLIARVDPRGTAQLAIGEEQNILQSVQQLAQLYFAAQTAGVLGAFKALDAQPRKPQPEIYGITTGNTFQVTPIFDPSGQALRFKFDHVAATQIREPDGTLSQQLPRIERHTVNTEVQISNLELREVSRFEANAQIGIPTQYWGGVPILKDVPKLRSVPLIGWFVRKAGKTAFTQQSLIFARTTMYPTIGDITDLLTNPLRYRQTEKREDRIAR